jgi:hypothetical protein
MAEAQTSSRPGPWALDLRLLTSPVPDDVAFYPRLDSSALIPGRGFGVELGGHVYVLNLGPSRLGLGASLFAVRGLNEPETPAATSGSTATVTPPQSVQVDVRTITPQISFNFGSRDGWSYLSVGAGTTSIVTRTAGSIVGRRESEGLRSFNVGGGARWFLRSHFGVGFDLRLHLVSSGTAGPIEETPPRPPVPGTGGGVTQTPGVNMLSVSGGFSFK